MSDSEQSVLRLVVFALLAAACGQDPGTNPMAGPAALARAPASDIVVSSFSPTDAPRHITFDLTVSGSGFDQNSAVRMEYQGTGTPAAEITTNSIRFVSSRQLVANITIEATAVPGQYDVAVIAPGGKRGVGAERFEVMEQIFLGTLDGEQLLYGWSINNANEVVGIGDTRGYHWSPTQGAKWLDDVWVAPVASTTGGAVVVGITCGWVVTPYQGCGPTQSYGAIWRRQGDVWGTEQVTQRGGDLYDINSLGQIYGNDPAPTRWTMMSGGALTREDIPRPPSRPGVKVVRGNNTGQAVGGDVLWSFDDGAFSSLLLPAPSGSTQPNVNDLSDQMGSGELVVVGTADFKGSRHPVRWLLRQSPSGWTVNRAERLPSPVKSFRGAALAVNNSGEAVGWVFNMGGVQKPVKWLASGIAVLIPCSASKSLNCEPRAINDQGWIAGHMEGQFNGAIIWRP